MKNNANIVSANPITVQTHSWIAFGNQITCIFAALNELVQNAISAIIVHTILCFGGTDRYFEDNHVDVSLKHKKNGTYLYVQNNGAVADIKKVLDYGRINHDTALNQHGTGFKTAASFFNPTNDGWAFYTRNENHIYRVMAPYSTEMVIEEIDEWPFDDWSVSCVEIKVDDSICVDTITTKELGFRYSYAIEKGLFLTLNKKPVRALFPNAHPQNGVFAETINDEAVVFEYSNYKVDDTESKYYAKTEAQQGIYVFVNDCFAQHVGVSLIHKRQKGGGKLSPHNSMNGMISTINIILPNNHKVSLPFTNTKNAINWDKAKDIGKIIDNKIGSPFYQAWIKGKESESRKKIDDVLADFASPGLYYYAKEVRFANGKLRMDAIIYKEKNPDGTPNLASVHTIIEHKNDLGMVTGAMIGQGVNYLMNLNRLHPYTGSHPRRLMMVGTELSDDAIVAIEDYRALGFDVCFHAYHIHE